MQKGGLNPWHTKDLPVPTPSVRQPLFETSEFMYWFRARGNSLNGSGFNKVLQKQIWVCLICVISTYSNGAVQIRVGLELADPQGKRCQDGKRLRAGKCHFKMS